MEASITFKKIAKIFENNTVLADLSFGIEKNKKLALIGRNGSGKSTLLKILSGVVKKTSGNIFVNGLDFDLNSHRIKSILGYIPQNILLDINLTISENLIFYGKLHGITTNQIENKIRYWSKELFFSDFLHQYPTQLSYGLNRVVLFVRSLLHDPEIIIFDEPFKDLSFDFKELIWRSINNLDKTVFLATNNLNDVEKLVDYVAIIKDGNIISVGPVKNLIKSNKNIIEAITLEEICDNILEKNIR